MVLRLRGSGSIPNTNAVPIGMSPQPASITSVMCSSSSNAPHSMPNAGIRKVTVSALVGPTSAINRK